MFGRGFADVDLEMAEPEPLDEVDERRQGGDSGWSPSPPAARLLGLVVALLAAGCLRDRVSPEGAQIVYRRYCAACHGVEGRGDGPAAAALTPPPTDLTRLSYNVEELMWRIDGTQTIRAHGSSRMPVWGEVFATGLVGEDTPDRRARLHVKAAAIYARKLQRPAP